MTDLIHDLKSALRALVQQPGFSATTLLVLAMGIGANAAIFGILNAFLLKSLPFPEADRLIQFDEAAPRWNP
jgi:hypothetical protein